MSTHLRVRFGLERGDRVAFAMTNCVEAIEVMYAIWHAGLCAVPMNAKLHAKEFAFILENSGAKALLRHARSLPTPSPRRPRKRPSSRRSSM
jgi:acyl-CoA synthetase (AMP-forming)/AMP-acid ligase II